MAFSPLNFSENFLKIWPVVCSSRERIKMPWFENWRALVCHRVHQPKGQLRWYYSLCFWTWHWQIKYKLDNVSKIDFGRFVQESRASISFTRSKTEMTLMCRQMTWALHYPYIFYPQNMDYLRFITHVYSCAMPMLLFSVMFESRACMHLSHIWNHPNIIQNEVIKMSGIAKQRGWLQFHKSPSPSSTTTTVMLNQINIRSI